MQISIMELGAAGDGRTDDTAALKKALAFEGTVTFPAGVYLVREQLFAEGISLHWRGADSETVIRLLPADTARRTRSFRGYDVFDTRLLLLEHCGAITLEHLTLDANKEAFAEDICGNGSSRDDYTTCLDIRGAESVRLDGVTCRGGLIEGAYIWKAAKIRITRSKFLENGYNDAAGLQIEGRLPEADDILIADCEFSKNGFNGLELTGVNDAVIFNVTCRENGFDGIAFWNGSSHCRVYGAVSAHNRRAGITFRRNHSAGSLDVMQDADRFCTGNLIEHLVTEGNAYGIHWGCAEQITLHGWRGADAYTHALCYLYPEKDITAKISDAVLSPTTGEIYNPVFTPEDEEFYEQYGAVPHSDPARFKPEYL